MTAQPSVPIGQYTAQLLDKASADPGYGADFKSRVQANTVSQEDNVRQVVSKVQLGEADAAVVYSTDATPQVRDQLQIIEIPDALQTLATYPIAVANGSNSADGAGPLPVRVIAAGSDSGRRSAWCRNPAGRRGASESRPTGRRAARPGATSRVRRRAEPGRSAARGKPPDGEARGQAFA